jgi:DNA polymerase-3 subunit epsilon
LREPSRPVPRDATAVHGITHRLTRGHRLDYRRIRDLRRRADFVVAHYLAFDRAFVELLMPSFRKATWLCSRDEIDWQKKGFADRSLEHLATMHQIRNPTPHRAAGDAATLLALLSCRSRSRGRTYLHELIRGAGVGGRAQPQEPVGDRFRCTPGKAKQST